MKTNGFRALKKIQKKSDFIKKSPAQSYLA